MEQGERVLRTVVRRPGRPGRLTPRDAPRVLRRSDRATVPQHVETHHEKS